MTVRLLAFALLFCEIVAALSAEELKSARTLAQETFDKGGGCTIFVHGAFTQAARRACIALANANKSHFVPTEHVDPAPSPARLPPPPPPPVPTEQHPPPPPPRPRRPRHERGASGNPTAVRSQRTQPTSAPPPPPPMGTAPPPSPRVPRGPSIKMTSKLSTRKTHSTDNAAAKQSQAQLLPKSKPSTASASTDSASVRQSVPSSAPPPSPASWSWASAAFGSWG